MMRPYRPRPSAPSFFESTIENAKPIKPVMKFENVSIAEFL